MDRKQYKSFFDILEIDITANGEEITNSYTHLKKLYTTPSMATSPIADEFSQEERDQILGQIEEAYQKLSQLVRDEELQEELAFQRLSLKKERETAGFNIHDVEEETGIPAKIISYIEADKFHKLPDAGYLRWYITTYAKALGLDAKKVADGYMKRYRGWQKEAE
jgi:hypothetical protein